MSVELMIPGEPKDAGKSAHGIGPYADLLNAEVVAEGNVSVAREGRAGEGKVSDAEPDDVLELGWQDGMVDWGILFARIRSTSLWPVVNGLHIREGWLITG